MSDIKAHIKSRQPDVVQALHTKMKLCAFASEIADGLVEIKA
jgi:hypothetical protein